MDPVTARTEVFRDDGGLSRWQMPAARVGKAGYGLGENGHDQSGLCEDMRKSWARACPMRMLVFES